MKYVIGIDVGTTHCKAVAMNLQGEVISQLQSAYPIIQDLPGQSEQDPQQVFDKVVELLQEILLTTKDHQLQSIGFSAAMHSLLAVNSSGEPITNAYTWADARSNSFAKELKQTRIALHLYERTGTPIHPMSPLCKLMWLRAVQPDIFQSTHKFISIKEFIFYKLFGKYLIDFSMASATGLFDIYKYDWNREALNIAGINSDRLSRPVPVTQSVTGLREEYFKKFNFPPAVHFIIGGTDGCLANIGSGALFPGEVAITIGTSGAARLAIQQPRNDTKQRLFNYVVTDKLLVTGGAINNGGLALKWLASQVLKLPFEKPEEVDLVLKMADEVGPGAEKLLFLPYLMGERAPHWDADARGIFFGLSNTHGQAHLVRAIMEGVAFALNEIMVSLEEIHGPIDRVYASGGFIQSGTWLQILANILNRKLIVTGTGDASATGAALLSMYSTGLLEDWEQVKEMIKEEKTYLPDPVVHKLYQKYFDVYRSIYPKLKDEFGRLASIS